MKDYNIIPNSEKPNLLKIDFENKSFNFQEVLDLAMNNDRVNYKNESPTYNPLFLHSKTSVLIESF